MKKRILLCCLLVSFSAIAVHASRSRSSGRDSRLSRSPNIVKLLTNRIEKLEDQMKVLKERVWSLEVQLRPEILLKKEGKASKIKLPFKAGQVVYLEKRNTIKIIQIIDQSNMIVDLEVDSKPKYASGTRDARLLTAVPIVGYEAITRIIWIKGMDTSGFVDDQVIKPTPDKLFKFTGTKTYETVAGGTRTVFVLERLLADK